MCLLDRRRCPLLLSPAIVSTLDLVDNPALKEGKVQARKYRKGAATRNARDLTRRGQETCHTHRHAAASRQRPRR